MELGQGDAGRQFHSLEDVEIGIEVSEVEREDADDLRRVLKIGEPECGFGVLGEAIKDDLHELEWFSGAIGRGDPQA